MAAFVVPDGQVDGLDYLLATGPTSDWKVRLFQNDVTPSIATVITDLVEADFGGYGEGLWPSFGAAGIGPGSYAIAASSSDVTFISDGTSPSNLIYGYYIVDDSGMPEKLVAIERFPDAPVPIGVLDDEIIVRLNVSLRDNSQ
jgi:hypothetical protein